MPSNPSYPFYGTAAYQNYSSLPTSVPDATVAYTLDSYTAWVYNAGAATWSALSTGSVYANGNTSTAMTVDFNKGFVQSATATGNVTFTLSNPVAGKTYQLIITQDGTGSRTYTWPAAVKWPGGSAPTGSGAGKIDVITLLYNGSIYTGSSSLNIS